MTIFLSHIIYCSFAQNNRPANDTEIAVINKAVQVIVPMIDHFQNKTWQKDEGGADEPENYSLQKHPDVVMGVAPFNDWHFTVRQNSDYYDENIKPYYDKMTNNQIPVNDPKAMKELEEEGQKIKLESNLYVEVHVNDAGIPMNPLKNTAADLKIPGCYFSYKQQPDPLIGTDRNIPESYVVSARKRRFFKKAQFNFLKFGDA